MATHDWLDDFAQTGTQLPAAEPARSPGKGSATSRLQPASRITIQVSDPESAEALGRAMSAPRPRAPIQRKEVAGAAVDPTAEPAAAGGGQPLPDELRSSFEWSLGTDLSGVRVHDDAAAGESAQAFGAKAYATGSDIFFAPGQYAPGTDDGKLLVAHEVAHTVQQQGAAPVAQRKAEVSQPGDRLETEADDAARSMVRGARASVSRGGAGMVQRQAGLTDMWVKEGARQSHVETAKTGLVPNIDTDEMLAKMPLNIEPVNWDVGPRSAATIPSFMLGPQINANPHPKAKAGVTALRSVWDQVSSTCAAVGPLAKDFSDSALEADQQVTALNIRDSKAAPSKVKVGDTFGKGLLIKRDQPTDTDKLDQETKTEVIKAKDACQTASDAVVIAAGDISEVSTNAAQASLAANSALSGVKIAEARKNLPTYEDEVAELQRWKGHTQKAIQGVTQIAQGIASEIVGRTGASGGPGKGLAQGIGGVGKLIEVGADVLWDSKIKQVNDKILSIKKTVANSEAQIAVNAWLSKILDLTKIPQQLNKARATYAKALSDRKQAYIQLATVMKKATVAGGGSEADGDRVYAAMRAVPVVEEVIRKCNAITGKISLPAYTKESGIGAAQATNIGVLQQNVSLLKGYKAHMSDESNLWTGRLSLVSALIQQTSSYS